MDVCTICGKEFKNLGSHVRAAHQISLDEYKHIGDGVFEEVDEKAILDGNPDVAESKEDEIPKTPIEVTPEERVLGVIDVERRFTPEMTVGELCTLKGLTFKELGSIISQYQNGNKPHPSQLAVKNETLGRKGAEKLKDMSNPSTPNLHIAEALVKKYGFEVTEITRNPEKTWHLRKIA